MEMRREAENTVLEMKTIGLRRCENYTSWTIWATTKSRQTKSKEVERKIQSNLEWTRNAKEANERERKRSESALRPEPWKKRSATNNKKIEESRAHNYPEALFCVQRFFFSFLFFSFKTREKKNISFAHFAHKRIIDLVSFLSSHKIHFKFVCITVMAFRLCHFLIVCHLPLQ